jgi:hypothetical protein
MAIVTVEKTAASCPTILLHSLNNFQQLATQKLNIASV